MDRLAEAYDSPAKVGCYIPLTVMNFGLENNLANVFLHRWSWRYNCVGPLGSMAEVVHLTKMQLVSSLKI